MVQKIYINLAVRDLTKSMEFSGTLGFSFNPKFTDATAACMSITEDIYVMLLTENKFKTFHSEANLRCNEVYGGSAVLVIGEPG